MGKSVKYRCPYCRKAKVSIARQDKDSPRIARCVSCGYQWEYIDTSTYHGVRTTIASDGSVGVVLERAPE